MYQTPGQDRWALCFLTGLPPPSSTCASSLATPTLRPRPGWGWSPDPQGISQILSTLAHNRPAHEEKGTARPTGRPSSLWGLVPAIGLWRQKPGRPGPWGLVRRPGREDREPGAATATVMTRSQKALRLERKSPQEKAEEGATSPQEWIRPLHPEDCPPPTASHPLRRRLLQGAQ